MKIEKLLILDLFDLEDLPVGISSIGQTIDKNHFVINNKVPIPIIDMSPKFTQNPYIDVLNEDDENIGTIYPLKTNKEAIMSLNEGKFIAYLDEVDTDTHEFLSDEYEFRNNYLLLDIEYYAEYKEKYYDYSAIWGEFSHDKEFPAPYLKSVETIRVVKNLKFPTDLHADNSLRAIKQTYGFERYLKLYHHLELLYDKELLDRIIALKDNYSELGVLIKQFERKEIQRLDNVIFNHCNDIDRIAHRMNKIEDYKDIAKKIFFDFGKDSNPLNNDFSLLENILMEQEGFTEENCKAILSKNKADTTEKYQKFILQLSAYWIYRVRCSIAHNKIGEYIFSHDEEEFIVEFAEPLLNEIIYQVLQNQE